MKYRFYLNAVIIGFVLISGGNIFSAGLDPLFRITKVTGDVFVHRPDGAVVKGQALYAYPYGSKLVLPPVAEKPSPGYEKPSATIKLSPVHSFILSPDTEIVVGAPSDSADSKTVEIKKGTVSPVFMLPYEENEKVALINAVKIKTRMVECTGIDGKSDIKVSTSPQGLCSVIFGFTDSTTRISGGQFELVRPRRNNDEAMPTPTVIEIFGDDSFTRISCLRGSISASIQRGVDEKEKATLRTGGQVKIWRVFDGSGVLEAVSVMVINQSGKTISYSYIEGQSATTGPAAGISATDVDVEGGNEAGVALFTEGVIAVNDDDDDINDITEESNSNWGDFFNDNNDTNF